MGRCAKVLWFLFIGMSCVTAFDWRDGSNNIRWAMGCDFPGGDIANQRSSGEDCGGLCSGRPDCTHFTWTNWQTGTCWMKGGTNANWEAAAVAQNSQGTVCGYQKGGSPSGGREIEVRNNCGERIYVQNWGAQGTGPFFLENGQTKTFELNPDASSRVWAHLGCDDSGQNCDTTEGYVSLAEMKWDDTSGMIGMTWYDISQVDGYNLPITMIPFTNSGGNCDQVGCNYNLDNCPGDSKVYNKGKLVGCRNNNRDAVTPYSQSMKAACPNVYTWSKDDKDGMRACQPGNNGLKVIFC